MIDVSAISNINFKAALAERSFLAFIEYTYPQYKTNWHHEILAEHIQRFAEGKIKNLMVFMPPQHGKSEQTSRRLPAYLLGKNPKAKIVGCSYSSDLARAFNRDVQRIIDDPLYADVFPDTTLNKSNVKTSAKGSFLRNADLFEVVGHKGFYKSVGVGGSLTGTPADIGLIDDPVKDAVEATSLTYQSRVWEWYTQVFKTRLHNDSQQLLTMTRWHPGDLAGRILDKEADKWVVLKLEAVREDTINPYDPRKIGGALWPQRHSLEKLLDFKSANPDAFEALYQQNPQGSKGLLIFPEWEVYKDAQQVQELYYGLDFGFANPSALVEVGLDRAGHKAFLRQRLYEPGLTPADLVNRFDRMGIDRSRPMFCDGAREDIITMLRRAGYKARAAVKGPGSVEYGIGLMRQFSLFVADDSPELQFELKNYRYGQDAGGESTGIPVKENDHLLDAARYVFRMVVERDSFGIRKVGR